jgi:hypothetical protein
LLGASVALAVGYAWITTGLQPFTRPSLVATLGGGLVAIAVGRRCSPPVAARQPVTGAWVWAILGGAAILWDLQAFLQQPRGDHPTVSSMTNDLLQGHFPRAGAMLVWLAVGWWLARR